MFYPQIKTNGSFISIWSYFLIIVFAAFFLTCCTNNPNSVKKINSGTIVNIPEKERIIQDNQDTTYTLSHLFKKEFRIHTYINGNCGSCSGKLKLWSIILENEELYNKIDFIFYVEAFDYENFKRINNALIKFKHPIVFDSKNIFIKTNNNLPFDLTTNQVLTDLNNIFIDYGNFLEDQSIFNDALE